MTIFVISIIISAEGRSPLLLVMSSLGCIHMSRLLLVLVVVMLLVLMTAERLVLGVIVIILLQLMYGIRRIW